MSNNKLKKARSKIDKLDNKIFNLIKQRTQIVKYMLTLVINYNLQKVYLSMGIFHSYAFFFLKWIDFLFFDYPLGTKNNQCAHP